MPIAISPDFIPARVQPIDTTVPDYAGKLMNPIALAQQINSQRLLDQIRQQMAPLEARSKDLNNQMDAYKLNELNDPRVRAYKDATMQKAISDMGIIPISRVQGQPAISALPVSDAVRAEVPVDTTDGKTGVTYDNEPVKDQIVPAIDRPVALRDGSIADPITAVQNQMRAIQLDAIKKQMENPYKEVPADTSLVNITKTDPVTGAPAVVFTSPAKRKIEAVRVGTGEAQLFNLPEGQSLPEGWLPKEMAVATTKDGNISYAPKGDIATEVRNNMKQSKLLARYEANQQVKDFRKVDEQYNALKEAVALGKATGNAVASDQAVIDTFNQIINPRRGVTQQAFRNTGKFQSIYNKLAGWAQKNFIQGGSGLTNEDRDSIVEMAKRVREVDAAAVKKQNERFKNMGADDSMLDQLDAPAAQPGNVQKTESGIEWSVVGE